MKALVSRPGLTSVPANYVFHESPSDQQSSEQEAIPTIDLSMLTSGNPDQRSRAIQDLHDACLHWGFFMVINHGVAKEVMEEMGKACEGFFDLTEEEKREYAGKQLFDPIRAGTSFNVVVDGNAFLWRDFLKIHVHPVFHAPSNPPHFFETAQKYCKKAREVAIELLKGISQGLGLEESSINEAMGILMDEPAAGASSSSSTPSSSRSQHHELLVVNFYPPCPQPEIVMGLPPHSDHGLLTLLIHNHVNGLQVLHRDRWVRVNPPAHAFLVITGDHLEIVTNGKLKSVIHRATVNDKATRISIGMAHGPPLDTVVSPLPQLVERDGRGPAYRSIKYGDYLKFQQSKRLDGKSCLESLRIY